MAVVAGPKMPNAGLDIVLDVKNKKSYSGTGNNWYNAINGDFTVSNNTTWGNGSSNLTIIVALNILGYDTSYAYHPVTKWNDGTTNATFVLYNFQNFQNSNAQSQFRWLAARSGLGWGGISAQTAGLSNGNHIISLQYNSVSGGQMWVDGAKYGIRNGGGSLGSGNSTIKVNGGPTTVAGPENTTNIHSVYSVFFYNRELSDDEMNTSFAALRILYGL